jgi:outer membrane lipoprotein carrier protein
MSLMFVLPTVQRAFAALLLTLPLFAVAADNAGYQRVERFLNGLQGLQAQFQQTLTDSKGIVTGESSGTLAIRRPNRFRWDYRRPNEQLIVADGSRIWLYDKDLEQVTVRRVDESLSATPAMLLSGEGTLSDNFKATQTQQEGAVQWVRLEPVRSDTDFKYVRLGFAGDALKFMQLADKLGQTTSLEFSKFERNPPLDPSQFVFTVPPGADVIGDASNAAQTAVAAPPAQKR